jgi:hypothetical protein
MMCGKGSWKQAYRLHNGNIFIDYKYQDGGHGTIILSFWFDGNKS